MAITTTALATPAPRRPRTVVVGTMFASAAAFMSYVGLLAIYAVRRAEAGSAGQHWFPDDTIELGPSGFIFWTLIMSIFTVQWAVHSLGNDDRKNAIWAMALTALFGAAVFNQLWFIINDVGYALAADEAQFLYFVLHGCFVIFLIGAVVFLGLTMLRTLLGHFGPRQLDGVQAAALFWNTVVAMWSITWYVIYVTK